MVVVATEHYSIDDIAGFPDDGRRRELSKGRIVEWDVTTYRHGFMIVELGRILGNYVVQHRLGQVVGADSLVRIMGSRFDARGADVAFYERRRIPTDIDASATLTAPDFVIEVLSPLDRATLVQDKIGDWLRTGVRLIWSIDPMTGMTAVYHGGQMAMVDAEETLDGYEVVRGFTMRMRDVLHELGGFEADEA